MKTEKVYAMIIEKNIPLDQNGAGRPPKYPFGDMAVGDSVFFGGDASETMNPKLAARAYGRYHGKKFTTRKQDGGVRIWRTE
jgi:hypothetical protein